ncbi:hypothetical protein TYRP_022476 [Tyrophagus putrescentiae]|nr:hypothetical protein TYRP_022476 [Tyrophagus putrescentiae]
MGVMKLRVVRMRNVGVVVWIRVKGEVGEVVGRTGRSICLQEVAAVGGRGGVERGGGGAHEGERIGQRRVEGEQTAAGAAAAVAAAELADDVDVIVLVHHHFLLHLLLE